MKLKISNIVLLFALVSVSAIAQQPDSVVNKSVTIIREFQPIISDVSKIIITPEVVEPIVQKNQPVYSNITMPLSVDNKLQLLPAQELLIPPGNMKEGFLRLGIGLPINTLFDFMYPVWSDEKNRLDVGLHHLGAFVDKKHAKTEASVKYDHLFNNFVLYAGLGGGHDYFNYYGQPFASTQPFIMSDVAGQYPNTIYLSSNGKSFSLYEISAFPLQDNHWRFNTNVGIKSAPSVENLNFDGKFDYKLFHSVGNALSESQLLLKGLFEVPFEQNRFGLNIDIMNLNYTMDNLSLFSFPEAYSVVKLNPFVKFSSETWLISLGVKAGISIGGAGQIFTPSADISGQWNAVPDYFALYGGITGDLTVNSLYDIYNENRYLASYNRIKDTYTPFDIYLGALISPVEGLLFDFYGQHKVINNQYFYVNRAYERNEADLNMPDIYKQIYINRFDVLYSYATRSSFGVRTAWDMKNLFNIYIKGAYHLWNVKDQLQAWQLPKWDVDFGGSANITRDIAINTQFVFQNGRYALLNNSNGTAMDPIIDWSLGTSYTYSDWMSVFVKLNNILNKKYEFYNGYQVQGINFLAGVTFSF